MKKLLFSLIIVVALGLFVPKDEVLSYLQIDSSLDSNIDSNLDKAEVVRVVDGDTVVVKIDGSDFKLRLIGVDTPESVASKEYLDRTGKENTESGKTASEYTKSLLPEGTIVYLEKDVSDTDRYGRLLRYVWLEIPEDTNDSEEISGKMLNAILVKNGYAEAVAYKPDIKHQDVLKQLGNKKNSQ